MAKGGPLIMQALLHSVCPADKYILQSTSEVGYCTKQHTFSFDKDSDVEFSQYYRFKLSSGLVTKENISQVELEWFTQLFSKNIGIIYIHVGLISIILCHSDQLTHCLHKKMKPDTSLSQSMKSCKTSDAFICCQLQIHVIFQT